MQKYIIKQKIGAGSFGQVFLVEDSIKGDKLAMKRMKEHFSSQQGVRNLMEVKILTKLQHPNIIELKEVLYEKQTQEGRLFFEYCQSDICKRFCYSKKDRPTELQIKKHIFEIASALSFAHERNYIHRDLKPQNILIQKNLFEGNVVEVAKLCDFGISKRADQLPLTDYVGTRWYRAPQLLIKMKNYTKNVDVFSLGCIIAEFYNMEILFNGKNSLEQLVLIMKKLGTPTKESWPEFSNWCKLKGITYGKYQQSEDPIIFRAKPNDLVEDLVRKMLVMNPKNRLSSQEVLKHPYFDQVCVQMLASQLTAKPYRQFEAGQNLQDDTKKHYTSENEIKIEAKTVEYEQLDTHHSTPKKQHEKVQIHEVYVKIQKPEHAHDNNQQRETKTKEVKDTREVIIERPHIIFKSPEQKIKAKSPNFYSPYDSNSWMNGKEKKFDYFQTYVLNRKNQNKTLSKSEQQNQHNKSKDSENYKFSNSAQHLSVSSKKLHEIPTTN